MAKHRKHAKLKLRDNDQFAPNELAFLGSNCGLIGNLVQGVSEKLTSYKLAYFDASHSKEAVVNPMESYTFHHQGTANLNVNIQLNKFNQRVQFSSYDFVFINGNHFQGAKQILILDAEKEASVLKRLDQLNAVQFVVKLKPDCEFFDFLIEKYPTIKNLRCYDIEDLDAISNHIENLIKQKIAPVKGLVLAGGKSVRMGEDKGTLKFYGKDQRDVAIDLLRKNHLSTFLSVRSEQNLQREDLIEDVFLGLGPFGAICSAFQKDPDTAWLVLATDLPFVTDDLIKLLLKKRNPSKAATTIKGAGKQFPEPLITIWEPKSYTLLLNYLAQGYSCPRKVLINSDVEIVEVEDKLLRNINTKEDFKEALREIDG